MKRLIHATIALTLGWLGSACAVRSAYVVEPDTEEAIEGQLDGNWFTRKIYDGQSVRAVEIMYCPIQPDQPTVCRTSVVWTRGNSALTPAAPPAAPPAYGAPPEAASDAPPPQSGPPQIRVITDPATQQPYTPPAGEPVP